MRIRNIEKMDNGYDLILFGPDQYVSGKDAILSELYQKLLLIKGELTFDFPSFAQNEMVGMPIFEKLNQIELDLEIKKIINGISGVKSIKSYSSQKVKYGDSYKYEAKMVLDTEEGDIIWQLNQ